MNARFFIRLYGAILGAAVVIILLVWGWNYPVNLPAPNERTATEFTSAIAKTHSELFTADNQPIFKISKIEKPVANWYILRINLVDSDGPTGILIVNDPHFGSQYMKVIAGPESKFTRDKLVEMDIPGIVINSLRKEGAI